MTYPIEQLTLLSADALVKEAITLYPGRVALLSAFNPEDVILAYWISTIDKTVPIYFLETHKHFPETLAYVRRVTEQLGLTAVKWLEPDATLVGNIDKEGMLWQTQVNRCCWLRKVEPLNRALKEDNPSVLFTGRRASQHAGRQVLEAAEIDEEGRLKLNPLHNWSLAQRDNYMQAHGLPHHPLYALGYLSIGCAPCTTPVYPGEDERAGRWRHTRLGQNEGDGKTECGLHVALKQEE